MKVKQLIAVAAATMVSVGVFAQGQVTFANTTASKCYYSNYVGQSSTPAPFVAGMPVSNTWGVVFGLYYTTDTGAVPNPGATPDSFSLVPGTANISAVASLAGVFSGGARTIAGVPGGTSVLLQVRAWSSLGGTVTSYEQSVAAANPNTVQGYSAVTRLTITESPNPVPPLTGGTPVLTPFFVTNPVPEPSVVALGVLGLLGVLFIRRRK